MNSCKYSVLMSVQEPGNPSDLVTAIENMRSQAIPPEEYVIMVNGTVSDELRLVLAEYEQDRELFKVIWSEEKENWDHILNDTTAQREKTLLGTLINDIAFALINRAAENKRVDARKKQAEGIAAAKEKGIKFGRPQVQLPDNFYEVRQQWWDKKMTLRQAAKACGMALTTFYDKAKAEEKG